MSGANSGAPETIDLDLEEIVAAWRAGKIPQAVRTAIATMVRTTAK